MTKSCKSQGKRNKTMKKNTKKMQGGVNPDSTVSDSTGLPPKTVVSSDGNVKPITALSAIGSNSYTTNDATKVDSNSTTTTTTTAAEPKSQNSFFSMFKLPNVFGTAEPKTGGKRKSKSNKSNRKKSKYNKK
jgi:hypothetical protein